MVGADGAAVQGLGGFPFGEGVVVGGKENAEFPVGVGVVQDDGCGKAAQQRRHGGAVCAVERDLLFGGGNVQHGFGLRCAVRCQAEGDFFAEAVFFRAEQGDGKGHGHGLFVGHVGGGRDALSDVQDVVALVVQTACDVEHGRARLAVPQGELFEIEAVGVGHGGAEVVAGNGLAVVAFEIELHAFLEAFFAQEGVVHTDDFRTFFVHGHGVEVVHVFVAGGAHGVGGGACVFGELVGAQQGDVFDAADGGVGAVGGKFLVAEDGQPFFERELEPVAAGNAVARPVVEIFVGDDGFDAGEVGIGGGAGVGQHAGCVEDVQAFVFHRAHVEVAHGHDHVNVQVVFQPEAGFVPFHGVFQGFYGKGGFARVFLAGVEGDGDFAAAAGGEGVAADGQIARHECEQVARFFKRVVPFRPVAAV